MKAFLLYETTLQKIVDVIRDNVSFKDAELLMLELKNLQVVDILPKNKEEDKKEENKTEEVKKEKK